MQLIAVTRLLSGYEVALDEKFIAVEDSSNCHKLRLLQLVAHNKLYSLIACQTLCASIQSLAKSFMSTHHTELLPGKEVHHASQHELDICDMLLSI